MKKKKILSLMLVGAMALSMAACGQKAEAPAAPAADSSEAAEEEAPEVDQAAVDAANALVNPRADEDTEDVDNEIYDLVLGEFNDIYQSALEMEDLSERWATMALAEAKLLESGVFVPSSSQGGAAVINRVVPNTAPSVKWGAMSDRFETLLVTTEFINAEDYAELRALYGELLGTGTYYEAAKAKVQEMGYELKDTYSMIYNSDPQSWDIVSDWLETLSEPLCLTSDYLVAYDCESQLVGGLAETWENSEDGLTWTFHLRDAVWVDSQGREVAPVTADDFVAGAEHLFDCGGGGAIMDSLWGDGNMEVKNAQAYMDGEVADFSEVGIEAVDEKTLVFTLEKPIPYFLSFLTYATVAPINRAYLETQGDDYGVDPDHILYCGPYVVTSAIAENSITFKANESYWNKDAVTIKELNWIYDEGQDAKKTYDDAMNGITDGVGCTTEIIEMAKTDGVFDELAHISSTDATAYINYLNLNRGTFVNFNDAMSLPSPKTQDEVDAFATAVLNQDFRLAVAMGLDRETYNAQGRGTDLALKNLINSYTTGDFVSLEHDVTIDINGTETTFPAGTFYGEIVQAQIDADGVEILAWNPEANDGLGGSTGYDGWYDADAAWAHMEKAIEALAAEGIEVSESNPVVIDLPVWTGSPVYQNRGNVYKQSVESALHNCVKINLCETPDQVTWLYAAYYPGLGSEHNYDLSDLTGWGPDYGDPSSMLGTFTPYEGYCTHSLGLY